MNITKIDTLRVPGASLYYEVRGSGPVLLLIGAGAADAASFNGIAVHLADQYTVVSYDRRGYSRSPLDDPEEEQRIETHSDIATMLTACSPNLAPNRRMYSAVAAALSLGSIWPSGTLSRYAHWSRMSHPPGDCSPTPSVPTYHCATPRNSRQASGSASTTASQTPNCRTNRPRRKLGSLLTERSSSSTKPRCIPATRSISPRSLPPRLESSSPLDVLHEDTSLTRPPPSWQIASEKPSWSFPAIMLAT